MPILKKKGSPPPYLKIDFPSHVCEQHTFLTTLPSGWPPYDLLFLKRKALTAMLYLLHIYYIMSFQVNVAY